jgi:hypothetical protein
MIAFYIVRKSEDLKKYSICGLDRFNRTKDGSDDDNCNRRNDVSHLKIMCDTPKKMSNTPQ